MRGPTGTVRERICQLLREGPATARDVSRALGIREHDVAAHLEHVARSLRRTGERLVVEPATCLACGFSFARRSRYTRPSHCPECRSTRTTLPVFRLDSRAGSAR